MDWYLPNKSKMNTPEIPGSTIAQMDKQPAIKIKNRLSGVCVGDKMVNTYAMPSPSKSPTTESALHFFILRKIKGPEVKVKPKKNDQIIIE